MSYKVEIVEKKDAIHLEASKTLKTCLKTF